MVNFKRKSGFRDSKLIIIASEGIYPEKIYFEELKKTVRRKDIHLEFIDHKETKESHKSSPKQVLDRLNKFKSKYNLNTRDEL